MKRLLLFVAGLLLSSGVAWAEKQPFERYQSILDRHPFGVPPPGFDPDLPPDAVQNKREAEKSAKEVTQEQAKLQSSIHFSVITMLPEGETAVGFTDNSDPKAPRHYFMKVGEERDGWVVKEADAAKAWMKIAKDELEVELEIGGNSAGGKGGGLRPPPTPTVGNRFSLVRNNPSAAVGRGGLLSGGRFGVAAGGGEGGRPALSPMSLRARREQRQQERAAAEAKKAEAEKAAREEKERQAAEEREAHEAERAEQRAQLQAIQEELRRNREEKEREAAKEKSADEGGDAGE